MIEVLDWIVQDWFHILISIVLLVIAVQFKPVHIEVTNGSTYIEKVDSDEK